MKIKILVLAMFIFSSCGNEGGSVLNNENSPQAVARKFIKSLDKKNVEEAKKYCTLKTAQYLDFLIKMGAKTSTPHQVDDFELRDSIVGKVAYVFYKKPATEAQRDPLRLISENGTWKVDFVTPN
ncbi:DUF4878 domain-containing protein [Neolewinella lacunae]|uniref:DUF4878 domain-containing protein n=1 Tax=Neolewinella lacunae TaxID=1517758 RepID=A0A923T6A1_9BACT|nr:DUF4878 domain-containing protein [Neolewinella lacunae]MBC6993205.1 DUF4878 domain-containing protein [Neolewinella lacunae]MDN3634148.1 DUF4878 domain-containing protein [Neolewinella lacunae]